ncbi:MAG: 4Fe-4S dicluster domain-containing protein [Candidatus Omnitrophica bacterium]|nr:4Fe-4S dicluster domain-containing protein [Candidatus Omnitrophota bacterium]
MTRILDFAKKALIALPFVSGFGAVKAFTGGAFLKTAEAKELVAYDPSQHLYAMGVYIDRCIGCGMCARACKKENNVPQEPFYFRTWVERYQILKEDKTIVDSPNGGIDGFPETTNKADVLRSFFVPKLCNQCKNPPCVQVCPVGATYKTKDGVILIDDKYCIGCRYCIQACPYGARYLNPVTKTADKCTFCYHRVVKGMKPACVEVCPTQARVFGDLKSESSPMVRLERMNKIRVLKPDLNTEPKVYYVDLDGEVS